MTSKNDHKPPSKTRDESITLTCAYCNSPFHPWRNRVKSGNPSRYCSVTCRARGALTSINSNAPTEPIPVREADNTGAVVMIGTNAVSVTDLDSAETVVKLAGKARKASKAVDISMGSAIRRAHESGDEWRKSGEHWDKVAQWWAARQTATAQRYTQGEDSGRLAYSPTAAEGRIITLSGFGARLSVKGASLQIAPGRTYSTEQSEPETLYRGLHGVSTILWITNGGAGMLTLEAIKWCSSQNIAVRILTNRGEHLATIFPSPDAPQALGIPQEENGRPDVTLRRAQYRLMESGRDVPLARQIILRKLVAQRECLDRHPELPERYRGYQAIDIAAQWLSLEPPTPGTSTLNGVRLYEARAANAYYACWRGLRLKVDGSAEKKWPPPWKEIAERKSPLTRWQSPRQATNPAQAMLNLVYAMLESQVRQALNAIGADPACGVVHSDRDARDSLVYDIMEPIRGKVDHLLLDFIAAHTFAAGDFNAMSTGAVSIHPSLCQVLANMVRVPQRHADDEARWLRAQLVDMDLRKIRRTQIVKSDESREV
jgi:CRISPR-associated endonuclease Cas1